jgi:1-acyl-sn-glycerol-3-phosphate acyltransferase
MKLAFDLRFEGKANVPKQGPVLLIANHASFLDPAAVGVAMPRHICYLARKTLFRGLFGKLIDSLNAIPVDQESVGKEGLTAILKHLQAGRAVLVFPEGQRTLTGDLQPLRPGILLLIKRIDALILPVAISGAYEALPRTRNWPRLSPFFLPATGSDITVSVGTPIPAKRYRDMPREQILSDLHEELKRVKERADRLRRKG